MLSWLARQLKLYLGMSKERANATDPENSQKIDSFVKSIDAGQGKGFGDFCLSDFLLFCYIGTIHRKRTLKTKYDLGFHR
jgi:hypothetical protein